MSIDPSCDAKLSMVLIVRRETPLVLAVSSSRGRRFACGSIGSTATGMPFILTPDELDDDVRSIDTLTRKSSSVGCSLAWAKRRTNLLGAGEPADAGGACPTNEVHTVDGDSSPC
jgi:hypothetical protein